MKPTTIIIAAVVGAVGGGLFGGWQKWQQETNNTPVAITELQAIPDFNYIDLNGRERQANEWRSQVMVLNFWASWCTPCREETPGFVALQEEFADQGVQFVGIAIDDKEPVEEFAENFNINYPILLGDTHAVDIARRLGNRFSTLPFTVVAQPGGAVVLRKSGELKKDQLRPLLKQLIKDKQNSI